MSDNHPDCHGNNATPCRPDPQPEHGQDCTHSDDHTCVPATITTTSTTTTTAPDALHNPVPPVTFTVPSLARTAVGVAPAPADPAGTLAYTGAATTALEVGAALLLIAAGTALRRFVARSEAREKAVADHAADFTARLRAL